MQKENLWQHHKSDDHSLIIPEVPANNITLLAWRFIYIKIKISHSSGKWRPSLITYSITAPGVNELFEMNRSHKSTKKEYRVCSGTYFLDFVMAVDSIKLKQTAVHPKFKDSETASNPFKIILCEDYEWGFKEPIEVIVNPNVVTLYDDTNSDRRINSEATYKEEDLDVDYWIMGKSSYFEDEYYLIVKKEFLHLLLKALNVQSEDKIELLQAILKSFNGEECFKNFRAFLEEKSIPFQDGIRHD